MSSQRLLDVLSKHPEEWSKFQAREGDEMTISSSPMFADLYVYFFEVAGLMPYGVAKARTGDPDQWIFHRLDEFVESLATPEVTEEQQLENLRRDGWKI